MESATVARICRRAAVPFGCVRAVSDNVEKSLSPALAEAISGDRLSWKRLARSLVTSPGTIAELWTLAKDTRLAGGLLGKALGELLTLTLPFGKDL